MDPIFTRWLAALLFGSGLLATPTFSAGLDLLSEDFSSDPVAGSRFFQQLEGTESSFNYQAGNGQLEAVLDMDRNSALYLSEPFPAFTAASNVSFSFHFRIVATDEQVPPTAYAGLFTTNHVGNGGDGLAIAFSSSNSTPSVSAIIEAGAINAGGSSIDLLLGTEYLAVGRYTAAEGVLEVEIYHGIGYAVRLATSRAVLTNENFSVSRMGLQNGGASVSDFTNGSLTIVFDDFYIPGRPPINLGLSSVGVTEGNGATGMVTTNLSFSVTLSSPSVETVRVDYATVDGTAFAGLDYVATNGTLTFLPGETNRAVLVPVLGDFVAEGDEAFELELSNVMNGNIVTPRHTGTILDDDLCVIEVENVIVAESPGNITNAVIVLRLNTSNSRTVSVDFATADVTALAGFDYVGSSGTVRFLPGVTTQTLTLEIHGDAADEMDELFDLILSQPTHASLATNRAVVRIVDSSPPPTILVDERSFIEGASGLTLATVPIRLSAPSAFSVSAQYATLAGGSATAGADYQPTNGTVVFAPGETSQPVQVAIVGDRIREPDESFLIGFSNGQNATLGPNGAITIANDDPIPQIDAGDIQFMEGNSGTQLVVFAIQLSNPSSDTVAVDFSVANGTAVGGLDFLSTNNTVFFVAGATQTSVGVAIVGDVVNEADETFFLILSNPQHGALQRSQALATILNDDLVPVIVSDLEVSEGDSGTTDAVFVLRLATPAAQVVTVNYHTRPLGATADADYLSRTGLVTFAVGSLTQTVHVPVVGDLIDEPNEHFELVLTGIVNGTLSDDTALAIIHDDDPPSIHVEDTLVVEGDGGFTNAVFRLTLSSAHTATVSVEVATAPLSALPGQDYVATNGTVFFPPGETNAVFAVAVLGDDLYETNETFALVLSNASQGTIDPGTGEGTIQDDDVPPEINIDDLIVIEGACADFHLTLSVTSGAPVVVSYCLTNAPPGLHTPCGGNCCTLTIPPGTNSQIITLCVDDNQVDETNRVFTLTLIEVTGAGVGRGTGTGVIIDNDPPQLQVDVVEVVEGNTGTTNLVYKLRLTSTNDLPVTIEYFTLDGTAQAGSDYLATNGIITFAPGETTQSVIVTVYGDVTYELYESVILVLTNTVNLLLGGTNLVGTIINDDISPSFSIADVTIVEGDVGFTNAEFVITLSTPIAFDSSVFYFTSGDRASQDEDFIGFFRQAVFPAGTTSVVVQVLIRGDLRDEPDENFYVLLTGQTAGIDLGREGAQGLIIDDDPPALTFGDVSVVEGDEGTTNVVFTLLLSSPHASPVTVDFVTKDGTALGGSDYIAQTNTVTFVPGETNQTIVIEVMGDTLPELDETFTVCLTNGVNATLMETQRVATIVDDDQPVLTVADIVVNEPVDGTTSAEFHLVLDVASTLTSTVDFFTTDGSALAGSDYIGSSDRVTFAPGVRTQVVTITVNSDLLSEAPETFLLNLFNPVRVQLQRAAAQATILDGTLAPIISVSNVMVLEGNAGITSALLVALLSRPSDLEVRFAFSTVALTAMVGSDFVGTNGVVVFAPGIVSNVFIIPLIGDGRFENDEQLLVQLTQPEGSTLFTNQLQVTILNDDTPPRLLIDDVALLESDAGVTNFVFVVRIDYALEFSAAFSFATADGTATSGTDYLPTNGSITFVAGQTNATIVVPVLGDLEEEPDETFFVELSGLTNLSPPAAPVTGLIVGDDGILIRLGDASVKEGDSGTTNLAFQVSLSKAASRDVTVSFSTTPGTAVAGVDYASTTTNLLFEPGITNITVQVTIYGDLLDEPNETLTGTLMNPVSATIQNTTAIGTIRDDDPPCATINDRIVTDGPSGSVIALFTVVLSSPSDIETSIQFYTTNGSATAGADYVATSGNIIFAPQMTQTNIAVSVKANTLDETNEFFFVVLASATNATFCDAIGLCTIANTNIPNVPPLVSLIVPGAESCFTAPTNLAIAATASDPDGTIVKVLFYGGSNLLGQVSAPPYSLTWTNPLVGTYDLRAVALDNLETFTTSAPVRISITTPPVITVASLSRAEGDSGTNLFDFILRLSAPTCHTVRVEVATSDRSATANSDYRPVSGLTVIFPPGSMQSFASVAVLGDTLFEPDEEFVLELSNAQSATLATNMAVGTIQNDDPFPNTPPMVRLVAPSPGICLIAPTNVTLVADATDADGTIVLVTFMAGTNVLGSSTNSPSAITWTNPVPGTHVLTASAVDNYGASVTSAPVTVHIGTPPLLSVSDVSVFEGNSGTNFAIFTFTLSSSICQNVAVDVSTVDMTATAGADYWPLTAVTVVIPAGTNRATLAVAVLGDTLFEADEQFALRLSQPHSVVLVNTQAIATIRNDDLPPNVLPSVQLLTPRSDFCLTTPTNISLSSQATDSDGVIVQVRYFDGTNSLGTNSLSPYPFLWTNAALGSHTLRAVALDDRGGLATSAPVSITISGPPLLSVNNVTNLEGNSGTNLFNFVLRLSAATCHTVRVDVATAPQTATSGIDYLAIISTTVSIAPGTLQTTVAVGVRGDTIFEADEQFALLLTNIRFATLATNTAIGLIQNDDAPPNEPPTITILTPTNGAIFVTPAVIELRSTALDTDGSVVRVDYFSGLQFLGAATSGAPYLVRWTNSVPGTNVLTALATDNMGATGISPPVQIIVERGPTNLTATPLIDLTRCVCETAVFSTTITGCGPVTIRWRLNGQLLAGATTPILVVDNLKADDAGVYAIEVTGPCKSVTNSARLIVEGDIAINPVIASNRATIVFNDANIGAPYPSPINVRCVPGLLQKLTVTLHGFQHDFPGDAEILLAAPNGRAIRLMSDVGNDNIATNLTLTFDDAGTALPEFAALASGTYRPTDYIAEGALPSPAPQGPYVTSLSAFKGMNPNGVWSLFLFDDMTLDAGRIAGGWTMSLLWDDAPPHLDDGHLLSDGRWSMRMTSLANQTHIIEASSNLEGWSPVLTNMPTTAVSTIILPATSADSVRFYRAVRCP